MATDAISFFRIGKDGSTAGMRRSGRAWKKFVAEFGESVYYRPAVARAVACGMQPKLFVGRYLGHHAAFLIMTTDGVVNAAGFRRCTKRVDAMSTFGMLFVVFLGRSLGEKNEKQKKNTKNI